MGGGKKSSAPASPDYNKVAQTEAAENRKTAEQLTGWNRPTQNNPFGKVEWTQSTNYTPEQQAKRDRLQAKIDAAKPGSTAQKQLQKQLNDINGSVGWTQNETWDPRIMAGYDQALGLKDKAMSDAAGAEFKGPDAVNWDPFGSKQYADALYTNYAGRAIKEQGEAQDKMQTQLRQQGLQPGTEAYDRAYKNLLTSQLDANAQASLDANTRGYDLYRNDFNARTAAQNQAYQQADADYGRAWDTAGAANNLLNSQYRPAFSGFSGASGYNPADMMGAAQAQYNAKMGGYNAQQGKKGSGLNAGMGMMGSILG